MRPGLGILPIADVCKQIEIGDEIVGGLIQVNSAGFLKKLLQSPLSLVILADIGVDVDCFNLRPLMDGVIHRQGVLKLILEDKRRHII